MSVCLFLDFPFFCSTCRFRQYGLWERYTELYPDADLVYTVGVSDYRKDWFYAQAPRSDLWIIDHFHEMRMLLNFQACETAGKKRITLFKGPPGKSSSKSEAWLREVHTN